MNKIKYIWIVRVNKTMSKREKKDFRTLSCFTGSSAKRYLS